MTSFLDTNSLNIGYLRPRGTTMQPIDLVSGEILGFLPCPINENIDNLRLLENIIVKGRHTGL